jgi:hypothetical protein
MAELDCAGTRSDLIRNRARTTCSLAGEHAAYLHRCDAVVDEQPNVDITKINSSLQQHLTIRSEHVSGEGPRVYGGLHVLVEELSATIGS